MFGLFKKKSIELKYGRDNYVGYSSFEVNERNWILLLSSVFVEAIDLEIGSKKVQHDLLEMYEKGALNEDERDELDNFFHINSVSKIKKNLKEIRELEPWRCEDDLYYIVNAPSKNELQSMAKERYEDDAEQQELYDVIWKKKEEYEHTHLRTGLIVEAMVQVRLAYYFGKIREEVAWSYLDELMKLLRPLLTLFSSWEVYNKNLEQFNELRNYEYYFYSLGHQKNVMNAVICLNLRKESPLRIIPFEYGIDKSYPYNIRSHTNILPRQIPSSETPFRVMMVALLEKGEIENFFEEIEMLDKKSYYHEGNYIFSVAANILDEEDVLELPTLYSIANAYITRGMLFYNLAWEARGNGTVNTIGEENLDLFHERLILAAEDFKKAYELEPSNQFIWENLYDILSLSHSNYELQEKLYELIRKEALDNRFCVNMVSRFKQKRWGGSHQENLDWAREVIAGTQRGDASRLIIFSVVIERYDYILAFDEDEESANKIFKDQMIQSELNQYFEELLEIIDENYIISEVLIYWYAKVEDYDRLRQVIQRTESGKFDIDAFNGDYNAEYTEIIMNWLRSV